MSWFGKKETPLFEHWAELSSLEQLDMIIEKSNDLKVGILKDSTRCGISRMVSNNLQREWNIQPGSLLFYYLDLLKYREISTAIADISGVRHESPQVIIFDNGEVVYHASHHAISVEAIQGVLN